MTEKAVKESLKELNMCTRQKFRDNVHGMYHRNILKDCDYTISSYIFGDGTPFRFLEDYKMDSLEAAKIKLNRVYDVYRLLVACNAKVLELINELKTFTVAELTTPDGQNRYKTIIKSFLKDNEKSMKEQFQFSFLLSITVYVDELIRNESTRSYIDEFMLESTFKQPFKFHQNDLRTLQELSQMIEGSVIDPYISKEVPPTASSFSSTQRMKKFDGEIFVQDLELGVIHPIAKEFILNCLYATQIFYGLDLNPTINRINQLIVTEETTNFLEFLPRLTFVSQNKGKVSRPVFCGCDYADIALHPFMILIKQMMSALPSNFSRSINSNLSMYSRVYHASKMWHKGITLTFTKHIDKGGRVTFKDKMILKSDMSNIDSKNATERNSGQAHWDSFITVWNMMSDSWKAKTGITDEYLDIVKKLLLETPYIYKLDNEYGYGWSYGTTQGLKGSWDLLNWFTMICVLLSYTDFFYQENTDETIIPMVSIRALNRSCHNGDDAAYSSEIDQFVKNRLIENSLEGVISDDKSASESELGYILFSSAYVRTYGIPKLSNLRILSLACELSDPYIFRHYCLDQNMYRQILLIKEQWPQFFTALKNQYNFGSYDIFTEPDQLSRAAEYSLAVDITRFEVYKLDQSFKLGNVIQGTNIAPQECLTPSVRCRKIAVYNSTMTSERYEILKSGKALESCFEVNYDSVDQMLLDISNGAYKYVTEGVLPIISDPYIEKVFNSYIVNNFSYPRMYVPSSYKWDIPSEDMVYDFVFEGYVKDDQVIDVKFYYGR